MLSASAERVGAFVLRRIHRAPWSNVYGVGRALIALGTLGVVLFNDPRRLLLDHAAAGSVRNCSGVATLSLFCHTSAHSVAWARWFAVLILVAAASGWRPRWTSVPHWWITFSVATSVVVEDGGDQAATILTLLLLPVALGDARRWVWSAPRPVGDSSDMRRLVAFMTLGAIRVQVFAIYFQAFTAKLAVHEWVNGTAVFYYLKNPYVGLPGWLASVLDPVLHSSIGIRTFTWGTLIIELLLCLAAFCPPLITHKLLWVGVGLHLLFALMMGLPSFTLVMWGALVLDLRAWTQPFQLPDGGRWAALLRRRPRTRPRAPSVASGT